MVEVIEKPRIKQEKPDEDVLSQADMERLERAKNLDKLIKWKQERSKDPIKRIPVPPPRSYEQAMEDERKKVADERKRRPYLDRIGSQNPETQKGEHPRK